MPARDTLLRAHTRRRHAEHAAPRQACRASLDYLRRLSVFLVPLSHGMSPALLDPARHPAIISIRLWSVGKDGECVPLGVRVGGYSPSDVVPFSCWWHISTETRYIWHNMSQTQNVCLCLLMGMYRYELNRAWHVAAGPFSRSRSRLCRRTRHASDHQERNPRNHGPLVGSGHAATHVMYTRGTTSI